MAYEAESPKYLKLARMLRAQIEVGDYAENDALPSEPQLARDHGMSRPTVVRALELLRRDGLIEKVQGRGTFVRRRTTPDPGSELERLGAWLSVHYPQHMSGQSNPVDVAIALLAPGRAPEPGL